MKLTNLTPRDLNEVLEQKFLLVYGGRPLLVQAPGRVNLIGEHTDYNDGFVFPAAIDSWTRIAAAPRSDRILSFNSQNYSEQIEIDLDRPPASPRNHWSDYVIGVARLLAELFPGTSGTNLLIQGEVPQGAGLSSSASFEVAVCSALLEAHAQKLDGTAIAILCQRAENEFVGARCGIMDQFVSVHGKKDHALMLDCRSLEFRHLPLPADVRLVICNTMVRHSVAAGGYNERRRECELAVEYFAKRLPNIKALRDVTLGDLQTHGRDLPEVIRRRAHHVITENARVLKAASALEKGQVDEFGVLMAESHVSMRDDFEISCPELDLMVRLAQSAPGLFGARMTGGGFGGCTINLVLDEHVEAFQNIVAREYERATSRRPEIYVCAAADGVKRSL